MKNTQNSQSTGSPVATGQKTLLMILGGGLLFLLLLIILGLFLMSSLSRPRTSNVSESVSGATPTPYSQLEPNDSPVPLTSPAVVSGKKSPTTYSNEAGNYSLTVPPGWSAATNKYNKTGVLFGENATEEGGTGGVGITTFAGTIAQYITDIESKADIEYSNEKSITVNGLQGVLAESLGSGSGRGVAVLLSKNGKIYSIYLNSTDTVQRDRFNILVDSFLIN